jgi:hypothetical protein
MKTQHTLSEGGVSVAAARGGNTVTPFAIHNSRFTIQTKRSTVMNTILSSSRIVALFLVLCLVSVVALGQGNITNTGSWTNTGVVTANNFTNSGTSAAFTNSGASSVLEIKNILTTNASGADPQNFDVTDGEVRYIGNGSQNINHLVKDNTYKNLLATASGTSTKTLSGNITVTGTLTSNGSGVTVSIADKVLTVTGTNPIASAGGGAFTFTGGTVNYAGSAQSIFATTYGTLGTTAAGNKTMAGNVTVNTALNLSAGNLQINGNTLTIAGALNTTSGTLEGSTLSNITFSGTGSTTLPGVTNGLGTLTINRTGGGDIITLGGDLTVHTQLTLTAGAFNVASTRTLTLNDGVSATSGTLTSATDGTVIYNKSSDGQSVLAANYGNLTFSNFNKTLPSGTVGIAGTFTPGTATGHTVTGNTIIFNGGAQNIPSFNGTNGYNNLETSGGAVTKTVTGNLVVGGNFTNGADVTTNVGTFTLSISGTRSQGNLAATMQFAGVNNGVIFSTGTVEYNGTNQNITGHISETYANLVLSNSGTKTVQSGAGNTVRTTNNLTVNNNITLAVVSGGILQVDQNMTVNGTLTNDGDITILGDLTNSGSITNAGTITVGN